MRKPTILLAILATTTLTGCSALKDLSNLFNQLKNLDVDTSESESRDEGNKELFNAAISALNQKNYFMVYKLSTMGFTMTFNYEIDRNIAKVDDNYYDYSETTSESGYAWEYIYDSETGKYIKRQQDLSNEPAATRYLTRDTYSADHYEYNDSTKAFDLNPVMCSYYGFSKCQITVTGSASSMKVYIDADVKQTDTAAAASFKASFDRFGQAHVTLPTNYVEE